MGQERADAVAAFVAILGTDGVATDSATLDLYGQDIWAPADHLPDMVLRPTNTATLAAAVAEAARQDLAIAPRGGGMSYTGGYSPSREGTALIDLARMNRVLDVNDQAMTVTVEAGCTWKSLFETLSPLGLRTPFWGPLSGVSSTVGGGLSQLNAVFGAGQHGTTSESVVGLSVVLADGRLISTGARRSNDDVAFYRHYGPDLTGLFCGDCGALGVKAEITLRLISSPACETHGSFAFPDAEACLTATANIARAGLACDMFGFDPTLATMRLKRASLMSDLKALGAVATSGRSLLEGVKNAARTALAGRAFLEEDDWSLHLVCEGRSRQGAEDDMAEVRRLALAAGGREVEATIPRVMRAQPFTPLNNILGPGGERWVPVHGVVAMSDAGAAHEAIDAYFATLRPRLNDAGVTTGLMITTLSTNGFLLEPVFFWPEARHAIHEATVEPGMLARLPQHAANPAATALVAEARAGVIEVFGRIGAAHFQIGRTYPWLASLDEPSKALVLALKRELDPDNRMNPGVLDL